MRSYIDDYSLPLVNAAARADPSAKTVAATAEGEARTRVIRGDFAQLLQAERRTSAATARASASAAHRAYAGLVVGIGASIALVALYAGYLTRAIVGPIRRAATLAGRVAGGDLTARLPETGVGEVGALQRSFNVMAASLERDRDELTALAKRADLAPMRPGRTRARPRRPRRRNGGSLTSRQRCGGSRRWSRKGCPRRRSSRRSRARWACCATPTAR